jgi:hypothetical protein
VDRHGDGYALIVAERSHPSTSVEPKPWPTTVPRGFAFSEKGTDYVDYVNRPRRRWRDRLRFWRRRPT